MDQLANTLENLLKSGSIGGAFLALALAYFGGILSSLTPCIYPMIPITVGVVGGVRGSHEERTTRSVLIRGLAYVLGMAIVYSFLGVLAGITGQVFGSFTNTSTWYLILGAIMTFAALMMMDVIPFDPQAMMEKVRRSFGVKPGNADLNEKEATIAGAFLLGASSGFIAAPCTTPVLTAILGFIAQSKSIVLGLGLMMFFALGLGTILMVIATFAGSIQKLPRAGAWMTRIKIFSGIIILLFAEYLFYKAGKA
ncbi:MAG: sulfite exporter TauE/SafE family protein [Bdellovibrionales bacterium]|nr:sulfite exporter TauE/SafE family protein [Bdellovibrionales bacterium]